MSKPASVISDDFNLVSVMPAPDKTDSILIIDANAVLPQPIAFQFLEAITGRCSQVSKLGGSVEQGQLCAWSPRQEANLVFFRSTRLSP